MNILNNNKEVRTLGVDNNNAIGCSAITNTELDSLKEKIIEILMNDPDNEVKQLAEQYLIGCLYDATNDPENNPTLYKFFSVIRKEIQDLKEEVMYLEKVLGEDFIENGGSNWLESINNRILSLEKRVENNRGGFCD